MSATQTINVPMPADLARELEVQARRFGMSLPVYLAFLARVDIRRHDREFVSAVRYLFKKFPNALRKLAE